MRRAQYPSHQREKTGSSLASKLAINRVIFDTERWSFAAIALIVCAPCTCASYTPCSREFAAFNHCSTVRVWLPRSRRKSQRFAACGFTMSGFAATCGQG
jgi:hypothetical protein